MLFYLLSLAILVIDQFLKYLVHKFMYLGQSITLLNGIKLTYVRNTGAAFSLFTGFSSYLSIIGIIVVLAVIYFHHKLPAKKYYWQTALAFVLGGSLGNLVDRIFRSYVIDYIDLSVWPVFNLADIMINLGIFLIIVQMIKGEKKHASDSI